MRPAPCERPLGSPPLLDLPLFRRLFPSLDAEKAELFFPPFLLSLRDGEIDSPRRLAYFSAHLGHESEDLSDWEEDADGWAYDPTRNPRLARKLGNTLPGDGPRYKGRSPIQLTGRANYRAAGKALGLPLEESPERAAWLDTGFRVAAWYWRSRDLNRFADLGASEEVTRRINGGTNGAADRNRRLARAFAILGVD